jgi:hypothetical protein
MIKIRPIVLIILLSLLAACESGEKREKRPIEVLKEYIIAFKRNDIEAMKLVLSKESIKMAQQEAQVRNVSLDEIIKGETFFEKGLTKVEFKNEKIDEDKAQVDIKTSNGSWETIFFVKEDGQWKIAKEKILEENLRKTQENIEKLDRQIQEYFPDLQENKAP